MGRTDEIDMKILQQKHKYTETNIKQSSTVVPKHLCV